MPVLWLLEPERTQQRVQTILREVLNYAVLYSQSFRCSFLSMTEQSNLGIIRQPSFKRKHDGFSAFTFRSNLFIVIHSKAINPTENVLSSVERTFFPFTYCIL